MSQENQFVNDDPDLQRQSPNGRQGANGPPPPNPVRPPTFVPPAQVPQNLQQALQQLHLLQQQATNLQQQNRDIQQNVANLTTERDGAQHQLATATQRLGQLDALNAARNLNPHPPAAAHDPAIDNLVARIERVSLQPPPVAPAPVRVPEKQKVFTTDQERTAFMLQREAENSRALVTAVKHIATLTLGGAGRVQDLPPAQQIAFESLSTLLQQNVQKITENENLVNQMVNPNIGRSKQTLEPPEYVVAPLAHRPHYSVMQTSTLKDNIYPFNPDDTNSDIVRTWTQMKEYGTKHFFTENDYITAWSKITSGDALQQLHNMIHSKYSLARILKFWEELYSKTRSITDMQEIIDNFQRKKKEPLVAAMLRVTVDIDQMEYAEDPAAWSGIRDKQRRDVLLRIILPETFAYLRSRREAHEKNGYLLKVEEMIQEAHTFEQSYNYVPTKPCPEHISTTLTASMQLMPVCAWQPRANWANNRPTPMETDQPAVQRFTNPPPKVHQQQQQQRSRPASRPPNDPNRQKSASPFRPPSSHASRNNSPHKPNQHPRSQSPSPGRNKSNDQGRSRSKENQSHDNKRSGSGSSQGRRHSQHDQSEGIALPKKGNITSEAGKQAINLNIGDQNQYYQCNSTTTCTKRHVWPKLMTPPQFCPDAAGIQKN